MMLIVDCFSLSACLETELETIRLLSSMPWSGMMFAMGNIHVNRLQYILLRYQQLALERNNVQNHNKNNLRTNTLSQNL